ncbi:hypothetical protein CH259_03055 [Rhodococcus sp. 05-2254-4]|nr:hypothetical protein CH259_03055 [Rhodococcus sp. 05-2254-4]OZE51809.1 hypothetical protein CH261_00145 [Rhodococcus sp. 05-2254-3]OZE55942.1 hypothetical protein CH283_00140 [Rhodococcus sp. 05-2254-2]
MSNKIISSQVREQGKIDGSVTVVDGGDFTLQGMVTGTVVVERGGHARILGMVGTLDVHEGAVVALNGTCTGDVVDRGGDLTVNGVIAGARIRP